MRRPFKRNPHRVDPIRWGYVQGCSWRGGRERALACHDATHRRTADLLPGSNPKDRRCLHCRRNPTPAGSRRRRVHRRERRGGAGVRLWGDRRAGIEPAARSWREGLIVGSGFHAFDRDSVLDERYRGGHIHSLASSGRAHHCGVGAGFGGLAAISVYSHPWPYIRQMLDRADGKPVKGLK
jgi:hypothetical protein